MGGCDFSPRTYTYVDTPGDVELDTFALQEEDTVYKESILPVYPTDSYNYFLFCFWYKYLTFWLSMLVYLSNLVIHDPMTLRHCAKVTNANPLLKASTYKSAVGF